jgi:hypothetical protein
MSYWKNTRQAGRLKFFVFCLVFFVGLFGVFLPRIEAATVQRVDGANPCNFSNPPSWDDRGFVACAFNQASCDVTCESEANFLEEAINEVESGSGSIEDIRQLYAGIRGFEERTLDDFKELLRAYRSGCTLTQTSEPACPVNAQMVSSFLCGVRGVEIEGCTRTPSECQQFCQEEGLTDKECYDNSSGNFTGQSCASDADCGGGESCRLVDCAISLDTAGQCQPFLETYAVDVEIPDDDQAGQIAQLSDVCSGTYCTRDEVGRFMEEVRSECYNRGDCSLDDIEIVFINIAEFTLAIVGGLAFLMYVIGGMMWLLSGGNMDRVRKGKEIIKYATIGLVIVLGAYLATEFLLQDLLDVNRDVVEAPWD